MIQPVVSPDWKLEHVDELSGYSLEWLDSNRVYLSKRNSLYFGNSLRKASFKYLDRFKAPLMRQSASRLRLAQRLLRFMFYNVVPLKDETIFVAFDKGIGLFSKDGKFLSLGGQERPCRVLRSGCAVDQDGVLFFGEYFSNSQRGPIAIYRYQPGDRTATVAHRFKAGEVRHIHGLYRDPFTGDLWCMSGDLPHECRLLRTSDQFQTLETIGEGDESWRCISPLFTKNSVFYAMDAEFETNYIFRIDRKSGERHQICEIDGPVYYSHKLGDDLFFAVTAELCPSQKGKKQASIWHLTENGKATPVVTFQKDAFPVRYFLAGTIHFPDGPGVDKELYFNAAALKPADNAIYLLRPKTY